MSLSLFTTPLIDIDMHTSIIDTMLSCRAVLKMEEGGVNVRVVKKVDFA
jgi:hypothetical protein